MGFSVAGGPEVLMVLAAVGGRGDQVGCLIGNISGEAVGARLRYFPVELDSQSHVR